MRRAPERTALVGVVPLEGRGDLPFALLHGLPLLAHVLRRLLDVPALSDVVVTGSPDQHVRADRVMSDHRLVAPFVEADAFWASVGGAVLLHDPLCPLVGADFVAQMCRRVDDEGSAAAFRPVTDTVKTVAEEQICGTLDRDGLAVVTSPVLVPASLVGGQVPTHEFGVLAQWLRERGPLSLVRAPSRGRRVGDELALQVLECLDEIERSVREA